MHELKFVNQVLKEIEKFGKKEYLIKVPDWHDIKEFEEMLNFYLKRKGIEIKIKKISLRIKCLNCKWKGKIKLPFSLVKVKIRCPKCKSIKTEIIEGAEIEVI
jgi:Zn finger protein HypA/HybF involved in hydrogenase expression